MNVHIPHTEAHLSESPERVPRNVPVTDVRATLAPSSEPRPIGLMKGQFEVPASFFEPLDDELLDRFADHD